MKYLHVRIREELHKRLKMMSAFEERPVQEIVNDILTRYVNEKEVLRNEHSPIRLL